MRIVLYPEWIIDGTGAPPLTGHLVIVAGGRIEAVAPVGDIETQASDQAIDLSHKTLLPGLINNHVHLVLPGDNSPFEVVQLESDTMLVLQAAHNAEVSLQAGVTTVRDCGGRGTTVIDLRNAQANRMIRGARVISCGWPVTITGGHVRYFGGEADGEDALRQMVRRLVSCGVDFVKVMASGGGTPGSLTQYPSFSVAELRTIVDEAHSLGRPVAAHCTATAAIANALEASVDLIEHAMFLEPTGDLRFDPGTAEKLAQAGTPVTVTLQVFRDMVEQTPGGPERLYWKRVLEAHQEIVTRLRELGVTFLAGSDAGWRATAFDTFWKELDELVGVGMSPVEAVNAATGAVTEALGCGDLYGTIRAGRIADLVAVGGDVARGIRCVADVKAVFQAGVRVHVQHNIEPAVHLGLSH